MNRHFKLAIGLAVLTLAGCMVRAQPVVGVSATVTSDEYGTVYPAVPPPAPIAEYRSPPPGYGYLWVDGYWDWTGYDWAWSQGYWAPERVGYVYMRPRYVMDGGRWTYQRSYWNGPQGHRDYEWGRPAARGGNVAPAVRGAPPPAPYYGNQVRGAPAAAPAPAQNWYQRGVTAPPPATAPAPAATAPPPSQNWYQRGVTAPPPTAGPAPAAPPSRAGFGAPPAVAAPAPVAAQPPPRNWYQGGNTAPPPAHSTPTAPNPPPRAGFSPPATPAPTTVTPPPTAGQPANRNWYERGNTAPIGQPHPGFPQTTVQGVPPPQSRFPPPQSSPPTMGMGRGLPAQSQPQSRPGNAPEMGGRTNTVRAAPSAAVPGGSRPAPAPVQGGTVLKRKQPAR